MYDLFLDFIIAGINKVCNTELSKLYVRSIKCGKAGNGLKA